MNKTVLLIDDDIDEFDILFEALSMAKMQYSLEHCCGVKEGIAHLNKMIPDFIFMDMDMPGIKGMDGLVMLKKDHHLKNIPVVLYSNGMNAALCDEAMSKGASFCLKKLPMMRDLSRALKQILSSPLT